MLFRAVRDGDQVLLGAVARLAVARFRRWRQVVRSAARTTSTGRLRNLDLDGVLARLVAQALRAGRRRIGPARAVDGRRGPGRTGAAGPTSSSADLFGGATAEGRVPGPIDELKKQIEAEIKAPPWSPTEGPRRSRGSVRKPLPEDVEFMHATRDELEAMRKAIQPLTRKPWPPTRPQASSPAQGPFGLPLDDEAFPLLRGCAGRAVFQASQAGKARDLGDRRHLGLGGGVRPFHLASRLCDRRDSSPRCAALCSSTASTR